MRNFRIRTQFTEELKIRQEYKKRSGRLCLFAIACLIISVFVIYAYLKSGNVNIAWIAVGVCSVIVIILHNIFVGAIDRFYDKFSDTADKFAEEAKQKEKENSQLLQTIANKEEYFKYTIHSRKPFSTTAKMFADWKTVVFSEAEHYLRNKQRPAAKAADVVTSLKKDTRRALFELKEMEYKYLFLLDAFPELKRYIDDEDSLVHISDYSDYGEFTDNHDRVQDWISPEEYQRLSVNERNQLALNHYKQRHKSNWEIGMEYEMYIGYILRKHKFHVIQFGIENGLSDLGRDIIAERAHLDGSRTIYIIQCKRWSTNRELHENIVCQLFGTKIEYEIQHRHFVNTKVVPVLVTTTDLSDTAIEFAKRLEVVVKKVDMDDYPMIKCNINGNDRIYHLPFDQQYYTTKIDENLGERYAWTVEEAINLGFRRAMRWNGNN